MDILGNLFFTLAIGLVGFTVVFIVLDRKIRRISDANFLVGRIREEIDQIIVELNQTTDRNIALLEDRIHGVNELLARADKKIGLLKRETEKHEVSRSVYQSVMSSGKQNGEENRQESVLALYREGLSASTIANRLGVPVGEIELIVSLNERKR